MGKDAKHVKIGEWALAANIATHVGILVILHQTARKITKYREMNTATHVEIPHPVSVTNVQES